LAVKPKDALFLRQDKTFISPDTKLTNIKKNEFGQIEFKVSLIETFG